MIDVVVNVVIAVWAGIVAILAGAATVAADFRERAARIKQEAAIQERARIASMDKAKMREELDRLRTTLAISENENNSLSRNREFDYERIERLRSIIEELLMGVDFPAHTVIPRWAGHPGALRRHAILRRPDDKALGVVMALENDRAAVLWLDDHPTSWGPLPPAEWVVGYMPRLKE